MRLVKDRILCVWEQRRADAKDRTTEQQRRLSAIQQKLDKLDEAFLYAEAIDVTTYGRQRDKLREELTLAKIDHHAEAVDEIDVEGILAFAERILPRASDLWVQASPDYKQRLQQLFFPEGVAFDGNRFNRTAATAPFFKYLAPSESTDERVVSRDGIEPSTRRLRGRPNSMPIAADPGKTGSAFFSDGRPWCSGAPFLGIRCTSLLTRRRRECRPEGLNSPLARFAGVIACETP